MRAGALLALPGATLRAELTVPYDLGVSQLDQKYLEHTILHSIVTIATSRFNFSIWYQWPRAFYDLIDK
jgi:hypothetical protein